MATSVTLPALGESVTEGTVTRWLKQPGDEVAVDEPLLEVSTDKVDTEIPSPVAGTLLEIKVAEDETVEVGTELAVIGDASEAGGGAADGDEPLLSEPEQESAEQESAEQPQAAEQEPAEREPAEPPQAAEPEPAEEAPAEQEPAEEEPAEREPAEQPQAAEQPSEGPTGDGTPVILPALGESVTEGTVTRWLKQVGDTVEIDEPLLEISTDKVDTEI